MLPPLGLVALEMGRTAVATQASHDCVRRGYMHTALTAGHHLKGLLSAAARWGLLARFSVPVGAPLPDDEQGDQKQKQVFQATRPNTTSNTKREPT